MEVIIVALIGAASSALGGMAGVFLNTKLITYRIEQLESKVNKHNNIIERTYELEAREDLHEEKIKVANHRIDDLEEAVKSYSDNKFYKEV